MGEMGRPTLVGVDNRVYELADYSALLSYKLRCYRISYSVAN